MRSAPLVPFVIALFLAAPLARAQADNRQEPGKPEMPEIQPLWAPYQAALKAVAAERDKKLANLDNIYLLNLDKMKKERAEAVDLDGALAVKAEMDRLGAHQATSEEQRKAMPPALRALRGSYEAAWKGYLDEARPGARKRHHHNQSRRLLQHRHLACDTLDRNADGPEREPFTDLLDVLGNLIERRGERLDIFPLQRGDKGFAECLGGFQADSLMGAPALGEIEQNFVARVVFQFWKKPDKFRRGGARVVGPCFEEIVEGGVASEEAVEC